jgi:predicted metal-dependent hydrolase
MDERFHQGIRDFNERRYFEAHDVWEDFWHEYREVDRLFLQGLIQVAVGFYHLENGNGKGSCSQFTKALAKLEPYVPRHQGIEVGKLLHDVRQWLTVAERVSQGESVHIESAEFPRIQYSPQHHSTEIKQGSE